MPIIIGKEFATSKKICFLFLRDEKLVPQAIELNEQLHKVLTQHDTLLSVRATSTAAPCVNDKAEEEEDVEHLYRRYGHVLIS